MEVLAVTELKPDKFSASSLAEENLRLLKKRSVHLPIDQKRKQIANPTGCVRQDGLARNGMR